ncbi:tetratricopeptide repeat protein [Blastococcus goldschmidtiae]|uniref:Tetratricopeptide repeat protein n=1 Tax=Blastococcus goldschmidtiae TaxID=3075546 RepID=A0ABU2K7G8_9ACTN|nr:tetratricopeptide repeat protein [Blastococcus sp. DSM 46792]MDT0276122.1 tetratricopeptide repeat protein [Blastococcus sp. DSM 46792]
MVAGLAVTLFSISTVVAQPRGLLPADAPVVAAPVDPTGMTALQARLERVPGDWTTWNALGDAYLRQSIATADPGYYSRAEGAFARSLELRPEDNDGALTGQGALAGSRHDFGTALSLAQRALDINPYSAAALGVQVDALVELGQYEEAERALQRMLDVKPSTASLARASYYRELHGDISGARLALEDALAFASVESDKMFALQYLGELAFAHGDPTAAVQHYDAGLRLRPDDPALLAARAEARAALGQVAGALEDYENSVARLPDPGHLAEYATLLAAAGRAEEAQQQQQLVRTVYRLLQEGGSAVDLELAYYEAGLGNGDAAVAAAQREYDRRATVHTEDALAYALHVAGRDEEALPHALAAERLSSQNGAFAYHRGLIEAALGMPEARATLQRAVDINPYSTDGVAAAAALAAL